MYALNCIGKIPPGAMRAHRAFVEREKHGRHRNTGQYGSSQQSKCKTLFIQERYCKTIDLHSKLRRPCAAYDGILPMEFMDCNDS